jgi:hypothetical protein
MKVLIFPKNKRMLKALEREDKIELNAMRNFI